MREREPVTEKARRVSLSAIAQEDVDDIWWYTAGTYGEEQADRYADLLEQAVSDLAHDPFRAGSKPRPEIGQTFRSYHIALSALRSRTGIKKPRHVVIYFGIPVSPSQALGISADHVARGRYRVANRPIWLSKRRLLVLTLVGDASQTPEA